VTAKEDIMEIPTAYLSPKLRDRVIPWIRGFFENLNKLAFSLLLVYLLGILTGSFISWQIYKWEANRMVKLGGVIINERVYDVKVRP
jgi:hypothetical protein